MERNSSTGTAEHRRAGRFWRERKLYMPSIYERGIDCRINTAMFARWCEHGLIEIQMECPVPSQIPLQKQYAYNSKIYSCSFFFPRINGTFFLSLNYICYLVIFILYRFQHTIPRSQTLIFSIESCCFVSAFRYLI